MSGRGEPEHGIAIQPDELTLRFRYPPGRRQLAFDGRALPFAPWRYQAAGVLGRLLAVRTPGTAAVRRLRSATHRGARIDALVLQVDAALSLPAYLLRPAEAPPHGEVAVLAIHGHGEVEPCAGLPGVDDDYHHGFALALARADAISQYLAV